MSERKRIYLCLAHMSEDGAEQKYVKEAFDTNWVVPLGPNVNGFEKDLEEFVDTDEAQEYYTWLGSRWDERYFPAIDTAIALNELNHL